MHDDDQRGIDAADETRAVAQPWPHRGEGADIAGAALWLAGPDSSFYTGQALTVDGGMTAAGTRLFGQLRNTRHLTEMVGIAYGTTGERARTRRLS